MNRDRYLEELAGRLPLPEPQRTEVLEELAAHLGDGIADLIAQGRSPVEAEAEALRRLGPSADLARGLIRAHQARGQLLAAAGAGVFAALRSGIRASFGGMFLVSLAALFTSVAVRPLLGLPDWSGWTQGWNSVITGVGFAIGAGFAGAAAVRAVAARSWRTAADVRAAVALTGAVLIGCAALVWAEESLNWASVIAYVSVPIAFVVGTRFETWGPLRWRHVFAATALVSVGALAIGAAGGSRSGGSFSMEWDDATHGYGMIAPWWQEPASPNADFVGSDIGWSTIGVDSITVEVKSSDAAAQFSDWRLEAWRAEAPQDGWALTPGQTSPFTSFPATRDNATVSGTISFNREPTVDWAQVVLTAIGPDGRRYLLWASGPQQTEFHGSVAAWFGAILR